MGSNSAIFVFTSLHNGGQLLKIFFIFSEQTLETQSKSKVLFEICSSCPYWCFISSLVWEAVFFFVVVFVFVWLGWTIAKTKGKDLDSVIGDDT